MVEPLGLSSIKVPSIKESSRRRAFFKFLI